MVINLNIVIFFNIIFGAIFLKLRIVPKVISGAALGLLGTVIIFKDELTKFSVAGDSTKGLMLLLLGVSIASLGNIASAKNSRLKIPVIQASAFGMGYGGIVMLSIALVLNKPLVFDTSTAYLLSLSYLILFGSIIAFTAYLTLMSRIGPDKAAYAIVLIPLVAVTISTIFEEFDFTLYTGLGMALLLFGNYLALAKRNTK